MNTNIVAFLFTAGAVLLAEMGDKSQLLAMAFAAKHKAGKVMLGVFIATVCNQTLAVAVGNIITRFEGIQTWIQALAALSFLFFGLWTLRGEKEEEEESRNSRFGAVATVAIAFFVGEMGDKTQLATIAFAVRFPEAPVAVLIGSTLGMLCAGGIGILVGLVLRRRIPERTVKLISAGAFILFGLIGSYQVARGHLELPSPVAALILLLLAAVTGILAYGLVRKNRRDGSE